MYNMIIKEKCCYIKNTLINLILISLNVSFVIISFHFMLITSVINNSEWIEMNYSRRESNFIVEKSNLVVNLTYILCITVSLIIAVLLSKIVQLSIRKYRSTYGMMQALGYSEDRIRIYMICHQILDYLLALPFIYIISNIMWRFFTSSGFVMEILKVSNQTKDMNGRAVFNIIVIMLCVILLNLLVIARIMFRKTIMISLRSSE